MDTFVTILVISVFLAVLAYFKVPKVKEFVDSKVFRKKLEPSAPEIEAYSYGPDKWKDVQPSKPAVEPSKPVLATTPLTPVQKPIVGLPEASQAPISAPPSAPVPATNNGSNFYYQKIHTFTDSTLVQWVPLDILPDFSGRIKVTTAESPDSPAGDKPNYEMVILDNHGNPISPTLSVQYSGACLTGATTNRKLFGDHFVVTPGITYMVAVKVEKPAGIDARVIITINGGAM